MVYAEILEVRQLSGNRSTANVPDSVIEEQIEASDVIVNLYTNKSDWAPSDMEFAAIKQASELIASSFIRQRYKDKDEVADQQYKQGMSLLEFVNRRSPTAGERSVVLKNRNYRTFPANPNGDYYSSLHRRHLGVNSSSVEGAAGVYY